MIVLHIASIKDNPLDGVCVAVPQHILAQSSYVTTALLNINNERIGSLNQEVECEVKKNAIQLEYAKPFKLSSLKKPFDKPDLVVFHECYRPEYLSIARALKQGSIPYVIVPHGELREEAQKKKALKKYVANLLLFNRFIKGAEGLQCLSGAEIKATHFNVKKFIGTNGVNLPERKKESFSAEGIRFVYIGRYEWRVKGLDMLFDAIKKLHSFLIENKCHFDLYGPDRFNRFETVKSMVEEREISDLVDLHLEVMGEEKADVLLGADVFVQTSRHEGMPMGILEALGFGLPCLVTDGTALASTIEANEAGWNAGTNIDSIADALKKVTLDKDKYFEKGKRARAFIEKEYVWEKVVLTELSVYQQIVEQLI